MECEIADPEPRAGIRHGTQALDIFVALLALAMSHMQLMPPKGAWIDS